MLSGYAAQRLWQGEDGVKIMLDHIDYWGEAPLWDKKSIEVATEDWFKYLS